MMCKCFIGLATISFSHKGPKFMEADELVTEPHGRNLRAIKYWQKNILVEK